MENKQLTITEFEDLLDKAYSLKLEAEEIEAKKKDKEKELFELNKVILAEFDRLDKTSYVGRRCQVVRVQRPTVTVPKDPDQRDAFFRFLKERKIFENLVTVNHQTLNSFYKAEIEQAIEEGNHEFKIPGLEEPKLHEYLTFRKK